MIAKTYRKKPVEVEAMRWDGTAEGATEIINWILSNDGIATYRCADRARCERNDGDSPHDLAIRTREGTMLATIGDWVIREPFPTDDRRFYPCKPELFDATYEPVEA